MKHPTKQPKAEPSPDEGTTPCGRWRSGCKERVKGIDCQRTCTRCRAAGHPPSVSWAEAKPDGLGAG